MTAAELVKEWLKMKDTLDGLPDMYINLAELIDQHFSPRQTLGEKIESVTMTEIMEWWFSQTSDPHQILEEIGRDALRLYFTNNPVIEQAVKEITAWEIEHKHHCGISESIKGLIQSFPFPKETIQDFVRQVKEHYHAEG